MKTIKVTNCHECPFCNNDNEYGRDDCNLRSIELLPFEELPTDKVHEDCALLKNDYKITT